MLDHLARLRHPPGEQHDQPAQRVDLLGLGLGGEAEPGRRLDLVELGPRLDQPLARALDHPLPGIELVMLVLDLADHLLDQVLDRHQPVDAAIFVDHQRHVDALLLHHLQQHRGRHRRGHEQQRPQHRPERKGRRRLAEAVFQRQVLEVDQPERRVERVAIDGDARHPVLAEELDQLGHRGGHRGGHDLVLRQSDVVHPHPAQGAQHRRRDRGGARGRARLGPRRGGLGRLGGEAGDQPPEQPAPARRLAPLAAGAVGGRGGVVADRRRLGAGGGAAGFGGHRVPSSR